MGGFFKALGKAAKGVAKVAAPVVIAVAKPETLINVALGTAVKHGMSRVPNNAIPYVNLGVSTAVAYARKIASGHDWTEAIMPSLAEGGVLAAASTGLHQAIKVPLRSAVTGDLAVKVGPGTQFSF